jgi:MoaA/NifB/PqqE/SkfB family radical SAM enzyme
VGEARLMFCRRPFEQFYVTQDGAAHLCCPCWIDAPAGNVLQTDPMVIWRGVTARSIRKSILDGSFRRCTNCKHLPGPSGAVVDEPPVDLPVDRIARLTVAYDPTCNLRCPSCRNCAKVADHTSRRVQENLLASGIFDLVDQLSASGSGDPLASALFWDLLAALPASRYPRLTLQLETNALLLDDRAWERLGDYAPRVRAVYASADAATPETYALNRGGDWDVLWRNLAGVAARPGVHLQVSMVVQKNNFREMVPLVHLARSRGVARVYFSFLERWGGTYDLLDYYGRAVHLPGHPEHGELREVLQDPVLRDRSHVTLSSLP